MARDDKAGSTPRTGGSRRVGAAGSGSPRTTEARSGAGRGSATAAPAAKRGRGLAALRRSRAGRDRGARRVARRERFSQLGTAFTMTRQADRRLVPLLAAAVLVPFVALLALGLLIHQAFLLGVLGVLVGLVLATAVFGRRAQRQAYSRVEGQVGAAAAVLENMRGDWRVTPAVGFTREQDLVHRVLGRPGIILVGEGSAARARTLVINEKRRLARFVGDTPVYDVLVGDGDGQVALRGLERHLVKLPRNIKPKDVNVLDRKLKAMAPALPIPKGPVPGGGRMPRGKVR